jgi:DNA-binding Xre family transcriptional regulator
MLKYNLDRIFLLRGIENPSVFLMKHGFKDFTAYRFVKKTFTSISPKHLEKLCLIFNCTPNDLMEWIPDSTQTQFETTALRNLIRVSTNSNAAQLIKEVPIEKMEEFVHKIEEIKKTIL